MPISYKDVREDVLVCSILSELGEIRGRKKFQKMMYIAKQYRAPIRFKFKFYTYGPYSDQFSFQLDDLEGKFIEETEKEEPGEGYITYIYRAKPECTNWINEIKEDIDKELELQKYVKFFQFLNDYSAKELELVSSIMYIQKIYSEKKKTEETLEEIKPKYTKSAIEEAFKTIDNINVKFSELMTQ